MTQYNAASWLVDRHLAKGRGDTLAIRYLGDDITYHELHRNVCQAQRALAGFGHQRGDRVAMVVNDEPGFLYWFLGAMRGALVPVPLSTMLTATELAAIIDDAQASTVVLSSDYADHLADLQTCQSLRRAVVLGSAEAFEPAGGQAQQLDVFAASDVMPVDGPIDSAVDGAVEVAATTADDQAFWLYSSGTTGNPKGVIHRHCDLQASAETYAYNVLQVKPTDRFFSIAKLFFAFGLGNSLTFPLAVGAVTILDPRRPTPATVLDIMRRERPSLFFASPGFIAAILDTAPPADALASVRATVTAGEALPGDLQRRHTQLFGHPVLDGIGSTEATHIFISNTLERQVSGTSGFPVPGFEIQLRDDDDQLVDQADTPAYLYVRGPSIAAGYHNRPAAQAAVFVDGWLKTGDVYTRSAEGAWTFLGRNSDMIKAGGIWVSPAEVESVLIDHPSVREAAVVGAHNADGLETTIAFVVAASGHEIDVDELIAHCRDHMASFKRPREVIVTAELPKTATGKVQRFQLREQLAAAQP